MRAVVFFGCVLSFLALGAGCSNSAVCGTSGAACCTSGDPCQAGLMCGTGVCGPAVADTDCRVTCGFWLTCGLATNLDDCITVCERGTAACQSAERALWECAGSTNCTIDQRQMACPSEFTATTNACTQP